MKRWMAAILAILTVILSSFSGTIVGALVGSSIVPFRLFDVSSDPSGLIVGAIFGVLVGFSFGIWAAMGIMDRAEADRERPRDLSTENSGWLEHHPR